MTISTARFNFLLTELSPMPNLFAIDGTSYRRFRWTSLRPAAKRSVLVQALLFAPGDAALEAQLAALDGK